MDDIEFSFVDPANRAQLEECFDLIGGTSCGDYFTLFDIADGRIGKDGLWRSDLQSILIKRVADDPKAIKVAKASVRGSGRIIAAAILKARFESCYTEIVDIIVDERHRGEGVGKELIAFIESYTWENGVDYIGLASSVNNESAHRFFAGCGYAPVAYEFLKKIRRT